MNWTSNTIRVNIDTGELINKHQANTTFLKVKTKKDVKINYREGTGHITYTILYRKNPQYTIFENLSR